MAERLAASRPATRLRAGAGTTLSSDDDHARVGDRVLAYLLDSVVLFGFTMLFATASFLNIFLRSDYGEGDASDGAIWTSAAILLLTVPGWLLFNLALHVRRGQSIGQYVLGLRVLREDGSMASPDRLALYLLAIHPLVYHPLFAGLWAFFAFVTLSFWATEPVFVACLGLAFLSLVAPVAALVTSLASRGRRALHDRLADTKVVRLAG